VTITGSGFTGATAVKFGARSAASVTVESDTVDDGRSAGVGERERDHRSDGDDTHGTSGVTARAARL
jgi:hypothetical protein